MGNRSNVEIYEVAPRDGLQNESRWVPVSEKVRLVDAISKCGFQRIEVGSFVNPKLVPQMAGTAEVLKNIHREPGVSYGALVPNLRGFDAALAANVDNIAVFAAATEGFSKANAGVSAGECLDRLQAVTRQSAIMGIPVRGYVSCVLQCPYDGKVDPACVRRVAEFLLESGCNEISLGDTIGAGEPDGVRRLLEEILQDISPARIAGHFHDTNGKALANIAAALEFDIGVFDASLAGLGGCPFAPGSAGNVATEQVCDMLAGRNYETGLDRDALGIAAGIAAELTGGPPGN